MYATRSGGRGTVQLPVARQETLSTTDYSLTQKSKWKTRFWRWRVKKCHKTSRKKDSKKEERLKERKNFKFKINGVHFRLWKRKSVDFCSAIGHGNNSNNTNNSNNNNHDNNPRNKTKKCRARDCVVAVKWRRNLSAQWEPQTEPKTVAEPEAEPEPEQG